MNRAALEHTQDKFRPEKEPNREKLVMPIAGDVIVIHDKCIHLVEENETSPTHFHSLPKIPFDSVRN